MKNLRTKAVQVLCAAAVLLWASGSPADEALYKVLKVYTGASIKLAARSSGEKDIRIRYIGLDAPDKGKAFFDLCRNANRALVEKKKVAFQTDNATRKTKGRLPGYVHVGDVFVNAELIKSGHALVSAPDAHTRHYERFLELQQQARKARKGLWAFEDQSDEPYYVGSKSKKIFHRPSCRNIKKLEFEDRLIFRTKGEALAGGYNQDWRCCPLFRKK